jgi:DNA-binding MarR family transcriptional regulator
MLSVGMVEQRCFGRDLSRLGLTLPQFFVLRSVLLREQGCTMGALAGDTLQRCATTTGIVDRLARMGLVTRRRATHDRRQVLVELTPAGRQALEKARHTREKRLGQTLACLSDDDAKELLRLLRAYTEAFRAQYDEKNAIAGPEIAQ